MAKLRIHALREDMDLRQIDVAEATGIDQKTLSNYETGKTLPDADGLVRLADFFNVSIDYLVGRTSVNLYSDDSVKRELIRIRNSVNTILAERCPDADKAKKPQSKLTFTKTIRKI